MSEKTTRQVEEMKQQTIGVEVEMNGITRDKAARLAATYFGRSEERRVGKGVDLGGRRIIKKIFFSSRRRHTRYTNS